MNPIPRISSKKYRGLGDVVHTIAQPIAKVIDAVAGTSVKNCSGCAKRRKTLNRMVPFQH